MVATIFKWFLGLWMAAVVAATFLWLPAAGAKGSGGIFTQPELARIIILHLPNSVVAVIAAFAAGIYGLRYLTKGRNVSDDVRSKVSSALAAIFCILTTATGAVFARAEWGAYWNWDPKQICIFLLLLVYAAYFVLRAGIEDPEKSAAVGAVYVVFAAVMTPLLGYVVPKYMPSLHPSNTHFDRQYGELLLASCAGFIGLYAWMQNLGVRAELAQIAVEGDAN